MTLRILAVTCVLLGVTGNAFAQRTITGSERAISGSNRAITGSERAITGSERAINDDDTSRSGNMSVIDSSDRRTNLGISAGSSSYSSGVTNSGRVRDSLLDTRRSQFESESRPLSDKIEQRRRAFESSDN
ncbi:hypothetical protein T5B8_13940 [Salinisphaera sp. T5B8]|uniref:hypothetical protein n=1 Tax=Salinisphaera sp. T5B8 TaxID=1304154 RepID=UPI0033400694